MDMCQEISQYPPITTETTAEKSAQTNHGTDAASDKTLASEIEFTRGFGRNRGSHG